MSYKIRILRLEAPVSAALPAVPGGKDAKVTSMGIVAARAGLSTL